MIIKMIAYYEDGERIFGRDKYYDLSESDLKLLSGTWRKLGRKETETKDILTVSKPVKKKIKSKINKIKNK